MAIQDATITYYHLPGSCWVMSQVDDVSVVFFASAAREWGKMEPVASLNLRGSSETLNKRTTRSMSSNSLLRRLGG